MDGFQSEEAFLLEACQPVLVYQQGSEVRVPFPFRFFRWLQMRMPWRSLG